MTAIVIVSVLLIGACILLPLAVRRSKGFKRVTESIDYGGGLTRLPDDVLQKSYEEWAASTWDQWESGRSTYCSTLNSPSICPKCYYVTSVGTDEYMSRTHYDREARARWANSACIARAQVEALGDCRCDNTVTPSTASREAIKLNAPYGDFRG